MAKGEADALKHFIYTVAKWGLSDRHGHRGSALQRARRRVFRPTRFHALRRFIPLLVQLSFRRKGGVYGKGSLYGATLRRAQGSIMGCAGS